MDIRQTLSYLLDAVKCDLLREVSWEGELQGPSQRDAQLLLPCQELRQIDGPPQPPGDESGEAQPEDLRDASVVPDRGELAESREAERRFRKALYRRDNVFRAAHCFAQSVLGAGRIRLARVGIRNPCTVAHCPDAGKTRHLKHLRESWPLRTRETRVSKSRNPQ